MDFQLKVEGLQQCERALSELPRLLVAKGFVKAMDAFIQVVKPEIFARTPVRRGELRDALMHVIELDPKLRGVVGTIGWGKQGHKALWVEFGHRMVGHKPEKKLLGEVIPHPFARPAFEMSKIAGMEAFYASLMSTFDELPAKVA